MFIITQDNQLIRKFKGMQIISNLRKKEYKIIEDDGGFHPVEYAVYSSKEFAQQAFNGGIQAFREGRKIYRFPVEIDTEKIREV